MTDGQDRPRARLPDDTPQELRDFVRCRTDQVEMGAGALNWLPKPEGTGLPIPDAPPNLTFQPGEAAGTIDIRLGWEYFSITVTASIEGGKLKADCGIPGLSGQIDEWVDNLNTDLEANRKQLSDLAIRNGKLHLTKQPIAAADTETAAAVPAAAAVTTAATVKTAAAATSPTPPVSGPQPSPATQSFIQQHKGKLAVGAGALALGVFAFVLFTDDGEPLSTASSTTTVADVQDTGPGTTVRVSAVEKIPGGEVAVGLPGEPASLNAFLSSADDPNLIAIQNGTTTGVYEIDGFTLELIPEVVTELPSIANGGIVINDDGTETVRYQIRDEAVWADGTPISGDDFLFTYQTIVDPDLPIDKTVYEDIDPASVVAGPKTFEYTLTQPTVQAELIFGTILPKHDVEGSDFVNDWNDTMWVSGGPFIFDAWQKGEFIKLVRNDNYWKADAETDQQLPFLDSVVFQFIPETASLINAFKTREVDVINPPPSIETIEDLQALESEGATVEVLSGPIWEHLNFQFGDNRLAANPNSYNDQLMYRQAVAHAIDKTKIVDEILKGQVEPLDSYVDAFSPTLSTGTWAQYNYDPVRAQELVAEMCDQPGIDCDANPPTAIFSTTANNDARVTLSQLFISMFDDAGIEYEAQLEDSSLFFGETLDFGNWDLGEWAWVGTPGLAGLVSIHDVFDPEAPPPDGSNFYRWGTPAIAPSADPLGGSEQELDPLAGFYTFGDFDLNDPFGHLVFVGELPDGAEYRIYKDGTIEIIGLQVPLKGTIGPDGSFTATGSGDAAGRSGVVAEATGTVTSSGMTMTYRLGTQGALPNGSIDWEASGTLTSPLSGVGAFDSATATATARSFLDGFTIWVRGGGERYGTFLNDSLDPRVIDIYGAEACANTTNALIGDPTFNIEITGEARGPEPFFFRQAGVTMPDTFSIPADVTSQGETSPQTIHLSFPDGDANWITPCGPEPISLPSLPAALAPYQQGPSSVMDASTARFAEVRDMMNATVDEAELTSLINEAESLLADNVVIIPLYARLDPGAVWADEIGGYKHNPSQAGSEWNIEEWYRVDLGTTQSTETPATSEAGVSESTPENETAQETATAPSSVREVFEDLGFGSFLQEQDLDGEVLFVTPAGPGGVVICANGESNPTAPAPDVVGILGTVQDDTLMVAVPMAQAPAVSATDFSFAVILQPLTTSGQSSQYIWEVHDSESQIGERDESGSIVPGSASAVVMTDTGFLFSLPFDSDDPIAVLFAQGFGTETSGGETSCDQVVAAADPWSVIGQGDRWDVEVVPAEGLGNEILEIDRDFGGDGLLFRGEGGDALVRVLDGCQFNDHYWVFGYSATDVEYTLKVTDTANGGTVTYENLLGGVAPAITDTSAFATCP